MCKSALGSTPSTQVGWGDLSLSRGAFVSQRDAEFRERRGLAVFAQKLDRSTRRIACMGGGSLFSQRISEAPRGEPSRGVTGLAGLTRLTGFAGFTGLTGPRSPYKLLLYGDWELRFTSPQGGSPRKDVLLK